MKKILCSLSFCLLFLFNGHSQSPAQVRCDNFKQGVNLSNWLEAYWDPNWPDTTTYNKQFLVEMKTAGIKSVRLPICFALITDTLAPYDVDTNSRVFRLIDSVIQWTNELDMNLIIDNQHLWTLNDTSWRVAEPRIAHLWCVLARRYAHLNPDRYFFEILNEPNTIDNDSLNLFFAPIIDTIRQYAPLHSIIVSPTSWSNGSAYSSYQPLADSNLIYTFHSYDPYPFTHQGLSFVNPPLPTGVTYPNSGYDFLVSFNWTSMIQWRDSFHRPVFLGEFGVGIGADDASRCNWMDTMGRLIDTNHLSAFHWDVRGDFRLYNSGVISKDSLIGCFKEPLHLYSDTVSAIQDIDGGLAINVFPNPASTKLQIQLNNSQKATLKIINVFGQEIVCKQIQDSESLIDISGLSNGIYFVEIKAEGKRLVIKVIISH